MEESLSQQKFETNRDELFDVLKGIAIILVIVGHCHLTKLRPIIYSFHIPIFFFITGYFLKIRPLRQEITLSIKRLIIPYIFTATCICVATFIKEALNYEDSDGSLSYKAIVTHLLGFRGSVVPQWIGSHIDVLWFILALFWARIISISLIKRIKSNILLLLAFLFLGIAGIFLDKSIFIPYCISQGLCASSFIFAGYIANKYKVLDSEYSKKNIPILAILWIYSWHQGAINMAICKYNVNYILAWGGALGAIILLYSSVKALYTSNSFLWRSLLFCGRFSLIIFCVHAFEFTICNWKSSALTNFIPINYYSIFLIICRLAIAITLTFIFLKIKPIRENIFQLKKYF